MRYRYIIAETEADNISSHNILSRWGFYLYEKKDTYWWKLSRIDAIKAVDFSR